MVIYNLQQYLVLSIYSHIAKVQIDERMNDNNLNHIDCLQNQIKKTPL